MIKTLDDKRCTTPAFLSEVKQAVIVSRQEATRLRKAKQCVLVDHLLRDCPLAKSKRMCVRPLPSPMPDVHWSNQCRFFEKIDCKFSTEITEEPHPPPSTPRNRSTIKDFFPPQAWSSASQIPSPRSTVSSSQALLPSSFPVIAPTINPISLPTDFVLQSIFVLSTHVQEISRALDLSLTGALDHVLQVVGGGELSSFISTLPLPCTPQVVVQAIDHLKTGAFPWVLGADVGEICCCV